MSELIDVPIKDIVLSKQNPRDAKHKKNGSLKHLKESIKLFGFNRATPICVRPHPGQKGKYELRAGERRTIACKELGLETIPAIVLKADDKTAMEITALENSERIDLTTAEQIKQTNELIKVYGDDTKTIADKLGLTEQQVRLRKNAARNLSKKWKSWIEKGTEGVDLLSLAVLDIIARLPVKIQDHILDIEHGNRGTVLFDRNNKPLSAGKLEKWINSTFLHALDKAPWDLDLKLANKVACNDCKERSDCKGQQELWDVATTKKKSKPVFCLNAHCWELKTFAVMRAKIKEAVKEHGKKLAYGYTQGRSYNEEQRLCDSLAIKREWLESFPGHFGTSYIRYEECKAGEGQPVFIVDGPNAGKIKWRRKPQKKDKAGSASGSGKPKVLTLKERRENLKGLRLKLVYPKLSEAIRVCDKPKDDSLVFAATVAIIYGCSPSFWSGAQTAHDEETEYDKFRRIVKSKTFEFIEDGHEKKTVKVDHANALWRLARGRFRSAVPCNPNAQDALEAEKECRFVASLVGFDFDKALEEAAKHKPEPKSWKNLKADGTPK